MGLLNYSTTKEVVINSWRLRILKLFFQFLVAGYLAWVILTYKGYQKEEIGFGFTQCKAKGNSYSLVNNSTVQVWDGIDVVYPAKERDAIFLTTNYLITMKQSRDVCTTPSIKCNDPQCQKMHPIFEGTGVSTGECDNSTNLCKLYAWCPIEVDLPPTDATVLKNVENFSIFIRNYARWTSWDRGVKTPSSPINGVNLFTIKDIIEGSGYHVQDVLVKGSAVAFNTIWNCNFNKPESECKPSFQFIRLDDPESKLSSGFNFRYAKTYRLDETGSQYRDLYKVYGIRVVFLTTAIGHKFDLVSLVINIGSAVGMLFLANYMADLVCMWFLPSSPFYRNKKFMNVDEQKLEAKRQEWRGILTQEQLNKAYF